MQNTINPVTTEVATVEPKIGVVARIRSSFIARLGGVFAALSVILLGGTPAHAAGDPGLLNGAETTYFDKITGFLTGNLLPLVFVLAAIVVGAGMLIRWGRRAVSS